MANDIIEMTILEDDAPLSMSIVDHDPYYVGAEAKVEAVTNGAKITCKDKSGTTTATVYNGADGQDGQDGEDGNGIASVTLNDDYTLTILLTDGTSVTTESIRGEQGEAGQDGTDGNDGFSPTIEVTSVSGGHQVAVTDVEGTQTFDVMDGADGQDGQDGSDGEDGFSPSASVSKSGSTVTITITDKDGTTTESVEEGITTETDPIFFASAAHGITTSDITSWNGKYEKPSGGIPKTDLESAVQTSLGKADTALQSFTETDPTVPSWAKASSKPSYTASEVGALPDDTYIPTKVSDLQNDSGYITGYTETDPTVPSWAKASTKPSYTASEVGALPSTTFIPSDTGDLTNGAGFITSSALPTALSDLTNDMNVGDFPNDAGYLTSFTEQDPIFGASAAAGITASDITAWNGKSDFSGSYNDLTDKPTIPTVNNAKLTIQRNGTTVKTFTANASSNVTANITVPTATSDLTEDSGFAYAVDTDIDASVETLFTALGWTAPS